MLGHMIPPSQINPYPLTLCHRLALGVSVLTTVVLAVVVVLGVVRFNTPHKVNVCIKSVGDAFCKDKSCTC